MQNIHTLITMRNQLNIDLRDLRYFETIAELSHLGRASAVLHRSQPALTKCVRRIENALGAPLFEREGRGLKLTVVGREFYLRARQIRETSERCLGDMKDFVKGRVGKVRLGCGPITADYLLPSICGLILREAPGVALEIMVGTSYFLREQMRDGQLDITVGVVSSDDEFASQSIIDDIVVVAANRHHPILRRKSLELRHLLDYSWILPTRQVASRRWLDDVFLSRGLAAPDPHVETNILPYLHEVIDSTPLLSFLSRRVLAHPKVRGQLREVALPETTMARQLGISYPPGERSPACTQVIALMNSPGLRALLSERLEVLEDGEPGRATTR